MGKRFCASVFPAMLAFAFSGVYAIVDGFFVGQNVGDVGLAGIGIAYPMTAIIQAVGTGIGMGGAVHIATCLGRGDAEGARRYLGNTLTLLLLGGILVMALLFATYWFLLPVMGAQGAVLKEATTYATIIQLGALFQVMATGLTPILRNYGASILAMCAMISGFVTNIVLDYLLVSVIPLGMAGAALATIIGQAVTTVPCIWFLLRRKRSELSRASLTPQRAVCASILKVGISPFGLSMSPNLVIICMNKSAMVYGGDTAVAAYTVVAYVVSIIQYLLQGVGDGSQPLISFYQGQREYATAKRVRNMAYLTAFFTAALFLALCWGLRYGIPIFFGASEQAAALTAQALPLFAVGALFMAFLRVTTAYFYSLQKNGAAYCLVYGEPCLLLLLLLFVLPPLLGLWGVWLSTPVTQGILLLAGGALLLANRNTVPHALEQPLPDK